MERKNTDAMSCLHEDSHWENRGKFRIHRCDECGTLLSREKRQPLNDQTWPVTIVHKRRAYYTECGKRVKKGEVVTTRNDVKVTCPDCLNEMHSYENAVRIGICGLCEERPATIPENNPDRCDECQASLVKQVRRSEAGVKAAEARRKRR